MNNVKMMAMGLKSFFEIFDFLEFNEYGEYSVNWKKLIKASIIIFLFVTFLATFIMVAKGNIFPTEIVFLFPAEFEFFRPAEIAEMAEILVSH